MNNSCPNCGQPTEGGPCGCGLPPGTVIGGRYELVRALGRGAAGTVYEAYDQALEETVALKLLEETAPEAATRFRLEIKLARRVTHPCVCRIHDYGQEGQRRFICMELIQGRNLRDLLAERGPRPAAEACALAIQAAEALQAIHDADILHRDVKTANLILDRRGVLHLTDFGIATPWGSQAPPPREGAAYVAGTPEYMSPEQARGFGLDPRSDVYGLGVVLFELLTGEVPFEGKGATETLLKHMREPPPLDRLAALGVSPEVVAVLERTLAKDPRDRPTSARELAHLLRALVGVGALGPRGSDAMPATTLVSNTVTLRRRQRPGRLKAAIRLGAAAAVAVMALWATGGGHRPSPAVPLVRPADVDRRDLPAADQPLSTMVARHRRSRPAKRPRAAIPVPPEAPPESAAGPAADGVAAAVPVPEAPAPEYAPESTTPEPGLLQLGVAPWAHVTLDGVPLGTTPLPAVPLRPGTHTARMDHPDFRPLVRKVTIRPGETTPLRVDLRLDGIRNR